MVVLGMMDGAYAPTMGLIQREVIIAGLLRKVPLLQRAQQLCYPRLTIAAFAAQIAVDHMTRTIVSGLLRRMAAYGAKDSVSVRMVGFTQKVLTIVGRQVRQPPQLPQALCLQHPCLLRMAVFVWATRVILTTNPIVTGWPRTTGVNGAMDIAFAATEAHFPRAAKSAGRPVPPQHLHYLLARIQSLQLEVLQLQLQP